MNKKIADEDIAGNGSVVSDNLVEFETSNVEVVEKSTYKPKWNTQSCKVVSKVGRDKVIVDFNGFGLIIPNDKFDKNDTKSVDIKYCGTIGKSDFSYEVK